MGTYEGALDADSLGLAILHFSGRWHVSGALATVLGGPDIHA
jgi:hypothetical protein